MTVSTHVSAVFSYSEGYFALKARKNIFCLGRQKMFFMRKSDREVRKAG